MTEEELHDLTHEHVSELMEYGEVEYADIMNTLTLDFVINEVTENIDDNEFKKWILLATRHENMNLGRLIRECVKDKAYDIIWENLSALNVDTEE